MGSAGLDERSSGSRHNMNINTPEETGRVRLDILSMLRSGMESIRFLFLPRLREYSTFHFCVQVVPSLMTSDA